MRTLTVNQVQAFDHGDYETGRLRRWTRFDEIAPLLPKAGSFLDIGGGPGHLADLLLESRPCHVTLSDASEYLLARNTSHPNKTLCRRVAPDLPDGPFDVIFCHRLLHHLVGDSYRESLGLIRRTLEACRARLATGGHLSIIENTWDGYVNCANWMLYRLTSSKILRPMTKRLANTAGVGVCYLSDSQWRQMLAECGFSVEAAQDFGCIYYRRWTRRLLLCKRARAIHYWCHA